MAAKEPPHDSRGEERRGYQGTMGIWQLGNPSHDKSYYTKVDGG